MARPTAIDDETLLQRLASVFRRDGYEGASMASLSEGTGLKKASLYHRFPEGKEEMARAALTRAMANMDETVLAHLDGDGPLDARLATFGNAMRDYYDDGQDACLLNLFAGPVGIDRAFDTPISGALRQMQHRLAEVMGTGGLPEEEAQAHAEDFVAAVQGGLVLARGVGDPDAFARVVSRACDSLIGAVRSRTATRAFPSFD